MIKLRRGSKKGGKEQKCADGDEPSEAPAKIKENLKRMKAQDTGGSYAEKRDQNLGKSQGGPTGYFIPPESMEKKQRGPKFQGPRRARDDHKRRGGLSCEGKKKSVCRAKKVK